MHQIIVKAQSNIQTTGPLNQLFGSNDSQITVKQVIK